MKKFLVTLAAVLAFVLTACGEPDAGTIYDKQFHESYYKTVSVSDYTYMCLPETRTRFVNGASQTYVDTVCRNHYTGSHNEQRYVEACWEIKFKNDEGDKGDECVGQGTYDSLSIGDWYGKK